MKFALLTALATAGAVVAGPMRRANGGSKPAASDMDVTILQYALTLEHLEATFYTEGFTRFNQNDFENAGFDKELIANVACDETGHVNFLETALKQLGVEPTQKCEYDFGITDMDSFVATASVLEGVGVSAYLGAAADIASKAYLTAAGSILTVEARHSAFIRGELKEKPFPMPFDTPLDYNQVYSLASQYIKSCPSSNPALPVQAFPVLAADKVDETHVKLTPADSSVIEGKDELYAVWLGPTGNAVGVYDPAKMTVEIPANFHGQQYIVLSTNKNITDDSTVAGPAVIDLAGVPAEPFPYTS